MPFEQLAPRLGPIAVQPVPHFNTPPVAPIGDIIAHGAQQVASIIDTFSPLNQEERKAKIALATMQTYAAQQARLGNWEPYMKLHGHFQDLQDQAIQHAILLNKLRQSNLTLKQQEDRDAAVANAFAPSTGPVKTTTPTFHKQIEDMTKRSMGITPTPFRPPDEPVVTPQASDGSIPETMDEQQPYDYPSTTPEQYWS